MSHMRLTEMTAKEERSRAREGLSEREQQRIQNEDAKSECFCHLYRLQGPHV